jgi:hypothetical protein
MSISTLVERLIELALERHAQAGISASEASAGSRRG